jgi:hypothetical protein
MIQCPKFNEIAWGRLDLGPPKIPWWPTESISDVESLNVLLTLTYLGARFLPLDS